MLKADARDTLQCVQSRSYLHIIKADSKAAESCQSFATLNGGITEHSANAVQHKAPAKPVMVHNS